ncbi:asparagine synthase (glutamine-hydrolyzing) [Hahella chejuensis KCTC 2396]|uniref:asparagine synthase (glutamine-hydrolyzing) n=1 Tax=Hahella chejuensis (strain KCTC 2396) TaxID=349521 RepID=Q2SJG5_HAHCH|nr:asparagine synthase (glutamine-hydrolyzing) [Hahella chejuensis]ABC29209.1 asparagine synthase (glutamine-hydrolyzing) [Hahella chejuensis KCTC 2396]
MWKLLFMCGIFGWIGARLNVQHANQMLDQLAHRGPDDRGEWFYPEHKAWLGHRRLSILDLSRAGRQPMLSENGRWALTFNGEIYNFRQIRRQLLDIGCHFTGSSDTEVLLRSIEQYGVMETLERLVGMFAFAAYDVSDRKLYLARDRMGVKPLYYTVNGEEIAFSSELGPLRRLPWFDAQLNSDAMHAYFRYLAVPAPVSIFKQILKLKPGVVIEWSQSLGVRERAYWSVTESVSKGLLSRKEKDPLDISRAADEMESLLSEAVSLRMVSDVPLGVFLSGGVDSSLVAAMMRKLSDKDISSFSIGFEEQSHDESGYARDVARSLRLKHHEAVLTERDAIDLVPEIAGAQDEPFADNSVIPTYLLSKFTREKVTVALSGDGGDELFAGYPRYFWGDRISSLRKILTPLGARAVSGLLKSAPVSFWDGFIHRLTSGRYTGSEGLAYRVRRFADYLSIPESEAYRKIISVWDTPGILVGVRELQDLGSCIDQYPDIPWSEQMMACDQEHYLPNDILMKVDWASMRCSLEAREPLLDHRLVEWSWTLPFRLKKADGVDQGKRVMRELLYRYVPSHLIERPKKGFGLPMDRWLRGSLRDWAESLLDRTAMERSCLINSDYVTNMWRRHIGGENFSSRLWTILVFRSWEERVLLSRRKEVVAPPVALV